MSLPKARFSGRLLIVANRLPVRRARRGGRLVWEPTAGGLVTAMDPILKAHGGIWVGWTGVAGPAPRPFIHDRVRIKPIALSAKEVECFYHGFSNATLWPLFHDAIRTPEFRRQWWRPYLDVNRRFARAAAALAHSGDLVWVHDYHLLLVPSMLRQLRPDVRIGFFLHIPFPPEELFAWLPWRTQLLQGLLGADVLGFQTQAAAQNFSRLARRYTSAEGTDAVLDYQNREVRVGAFPISVDFKWFESAARSATVARRTAELRQCIGTSRKIMLAIDRLDYTKGIVARLEAFEELLRSRRVTVNDCVLIQIAVPSRESVRDYAEMRLRIEQAVGRINGEYSVPGRVAVHYFRRSFPREELVPYYRAADVMLVTPLRDGMNLVAKEYVATRTDNSGVLVLSEFTGAAFELRRALLVNPRDTDGMVSTFEKALTLSRAEARRRMVILRTIVRRHNVFVWAEDYLGELRR
ncbi:MAG: trehalose-6-phosphate synthase [Planctomycetota bacterium]